MNMQCMFKIIALISIILGCDLTEERNPEKKGSGSGSPFGLEDKAAPPPPRCLILNNLQTLHISHPHKLKKLKV